MALALLVNTAGKPCTECASNMINRRKKLCTVFRVYPDFIRLDKNLAVYASAYRNRESVNLLVYIDLRGARDFN